jgi:hypothetical protein
MPDDLYYTAYVRLNDSLASKSSKFDAATVRAASLIAFNAEQRRLQKNHTQPASVPASARVSKDLTLVRAELLSFKPSLDLGAQARDARDSAFGKVPATQPRNRYSGSRGAAARVGMYRPLLTLLPARRPRHQSGIRPRQGSSRAQTAGCSRYTVFLWPTPQNTDINT